MNRKQIIFSLLLCFLVLFQKQLKSQTNIKDKNDTTYSHEVKIINLPPMEAEPLNPFSQIPYSSATPKEAVVTGYETKDKVIFKDEFTKKNSNGNEKKTITEGKNETNTNNSEPIKVELVPKKKKD